MSTDEFQALWKAYDAKLDRCIEMNRRIFVDLQQRKVDSVLRPLIRGRVIGIVVGILWLALMGFCLVAVRSQWVMAVSFLVFFVCTVVGIVGYVRDIVVIRGVSFADSILDTQRKLADLRTTMVRDMRLMWLQLPFWSCFFVSNDFIKNCGRQVWLIEVPAFLVFVAAAVFLYRNITIASARKKRWVAAMIKGAGARQVGKALEILKELEEYEGK